MKGDARARRIRKSVATLATVVASGCAAPMAERAIAAMCEAGTQPNHYPEIVRFRLRIDDGPALSLLSDSLGAYADDSIACVAAQQLKSGLTQVAFPVSSTYKCGATTPHRTWTIDLSHPLPGSGAIPLGLVRPIATNVIVIPSISSGGYMGLTDVPVGRELGVQVFAIVNRDNGDRLAFAPRGLRGCGPWIPGAFPGTTEARLIRSSVSRWDITLPPGSVGQLYQFEPGGQPSMKGRYLFQAHLTLTAMDSTVR